MHHLFQRHINNLITSAYTYYKDMLLRIKIQALSEVAGGNNDMLGF